MAARSPTGTADCHGREGFTAATASIDLSLSTFGCDPCQRQQGAARSGGARPADRARLRASAEIPQEYDRDWHLVGRRAAAEKCGLGERVLGLPREIEMDRNNPFRESLAVRGYTDRGGAAEVVNLSFPTVDSRGGKPLSPRHGTGGRCPVRLSTSACRSESGSRRPEPGRGPMTKRSNRQAKSAGIPVEGTRDGRPEQQAVDLHAAAR